MIEEKSSLSLKKLNKFNGRRSEFAPGLTWGKTRLKLKAGVWGERTSRWYTPRGLLFLPAETCVSGAGSGLCDKCCLPAFRQMRMGDEDLTMI
jgi:hypothetical protein